MFKTPLKKIISQYKKPSKLIVKHEKYNVLPSCLHQQLSSLYGDLEYSDLSRKLNGLYYTVCVYACVMLIKLTLCHRM